MSRMLYSYDPHTKEFTIAEPERVDPITGKKITRQFATAEVPPEKLDGHVILFNTATGAWEQKPDHRGKGFYFHNADGFIESVGIEEAGAVPDHYKEKLSDVPKTDAELSEIERRKRNSMLYKTDVTLLRKLEEIASASADEELQELIQRRQALRDIPQQEGFPNDIVWPEEQ